MAKKTLTPEQAEIKKIKKENSAKNRISFFAVVLAVVLALGVFSFGRDTGIKKGEKANAIVDVPAEQNNTVNENSDVPSNDVPQNSQNEDVNSPSKPEDNKNENKDEPAKKDEPLSDDPAKWSKEQIAEFYKNAATKSHDASESSQTMAMPKLVVNDGNGALGFFLKIATPAINAVLEKNSTTYGGITGGYANLVGSDMEDNTKAYKEGEYTIIEMQMVEQTDGLYGDAQGGTVGHAINVLGNVATAVEQFPAFDIKFEEADIKVHYVNPIVKVKINKDGVIEKGTWSYTSEIYIRHLQINSIMIDKADAEIEYVITVGGGF